MQPLYSASKTCQIARMLNFTPIPYKDKPKFYRELGQELMGLYETLWFTNLASASAALMAHLPGLNWAGFYLMHEGELRLGPFQGLPACLSIPLGKGVCGAAARRARRPFSARERRDQRDQDGARGAARLGQEHGE